MLLKELPNSDILIYGKTGMEKEKGSVVDSYFAGFVDTKKMRRFIFQYI
ncbi:MAG: hypothetical protein HFJ53_04760 [Clostridia bacterium]|jgi:hypothetical protein|nr:hypothetical protein [Clostridia bacterium]